MRNGEVGSFFVSCIPHFLSLFPALSLPLPLPPSLCVGAGDEALRVGGHGCRRVQEPRVRDERAGACVVCDEQVEVR